MGGNLVPKANYLVEYVPDPNVALFDTDFDEQADPRVGFHVFGVDSCPSCTHSTSGVFALEFVTTTASDSLGRKVGTYVRGAAIGTLQRFGTDTGYGTTVLAPGARLAVIKCACSGTHNVAQGAPAKAADATGCGSYWMLAATEDKNVPHGMRLDNVPPDTDYRTVAAARDVSTAISGSLSTVQSNASKWQTAMATLLGLLVVTSLVGGRDTLSKLAWYYQLVIGVLAVVSLLANIWAIYRFTLVSSGRTDATPIGNVDQLEQADLEPLRRARVALEKFDQALIATGIALLAALAVLLLVWFVPDASSPSKVQLTLKEHGSTICGTITKIDKSGALTIKPGLGNAVTQTYQPSEIKSIGNC